LELLGIDVAVDRQDGRPERRDPVESVGGHHVACVQDQVRGSEPLDAGVWQPAPAPGRCVSEMRAINTAPERTPRTPAASKR
jgi:hypothetical protein